MRQAASRSATHAACAGTDLHRAGRRTPGTSLASSPPRDPRRTSAAEHRVWNRGAGCGTGETFFRYAVKEEELPRRLEWSSSSRELPLFPSTIVLRKRRLHLGVPVRAQRGKGERDRVLPLPTVV